MSRRRHAPVAAVVASLALLATLPAPCDCRTAPVAAAEHACCTPPLGLQPADPGCCAALDVAPEPVTASTEAPAASTPELVVVAWATPPAGTVPQRGPASPAPAPSPPLTVRRL